MQSSPFDEKGHGIGFLYIKSILFIFYQPNLVDMDNTLSRSGESILVAMATMLGYHGNQLIFKWCTIFQLIYLVENNKYFNFNSNRFYLGDQYKVQGRELF